MKDRITEPKPDVIAGRNPVSEAVRSSRPIDKILVARGEKSGAIVGILAKAKEKQIPVKEVDRAKLDFLSGQQTHQGIIALAAAKEYSTVEEILEYADSRGEAPFIVILDELEDPHNLGAIIRTAECVGAHGVIVPKRRSASLSYTVAKASAGAVEYMRVARVTNISKLIDGLKERGVGHVQPPRPQTAAGGRLRDAGGRGAGLPVGATANSIPTNRPEKSMPDVTKCQN